MRFMPGWAVALLTFPGVIVHELAHRFFCDRTGTPVYAVAYFRPFGNPAGYVVHRRPDRVRSALLISMGPLIVNTLVCAVLTFGCVYRALILDDGLDPILVLLAWIGFSAGMHAFPSPQDAAAFVSEVEALRGRGPAWVVARVASGLVRLANALRVVWFDALYAVVVSVALPLLVGG